MSRKLPIAILTAALLALAAAPAGASAAEVCAPGTSSGNYCTKTTGVSTHEHNTIAKGSLVDLTVHCGLKSGCLGTLLLEQRGKGQSSNNNGHKGSKGNKGGKGSKGNNANKGSKGNKGGKGRGHSARHHRHRGRTARSHHGKTGGKANKGQKGGKANKGQKGGKGNKGKGNSKHSGPTVYAKTLYTLKANSTTTLSFHLNAAGRKALARKGELTVKVLTKAKGLKETIGTLHIKSKKPGHKGAGKGGKGHARNGTSGIPY